MRLYRRTFASVVVVAFCFKLWLLSEIRTIATYAPHDASNFLEHARSIVSGHWFGRYDLFTLIKQPFFPLYLAFVQESGMTLAFANICFDLLVALATIGALAPLFKKPLVPCLLFLAIFFQPISLDGLRWTTDRSIINPNLALLVLACAVGLYVRRMAPVAVLLRWGLGLGFAFAAFWLNREDAIWIVPGLLPIAVAYAIWTFRYRRAAFVPRTAILALVPVICVIAVLTIEAINSNVYGWGVTNEQQAPEFVSAYNSLARIDVSKQRYIPLPKRARLLAYAVSPAARELRPSIEGGDGADWVGTTCGTTPELCVTHDIGGGWAEWAFRDAVSNAGHDDTAAHARAFYLQLAGEIDAACADGRLKCRPKSKSVFPPPFTPDAPAAILASLRTGIAVLLTLPGVAPGEASAPPVSSQLRVDYDFVTRNVSDAGVHGVSGWILYHHLRPLTVIGPGSSDAQLIPLPSPDVVAAVRNDPRWSLDEKQHARFQLTSECDQACFLVATNQSGETVDVPLRDDQPGFDGNGVHLSIDAMSYAGQFDTGIKRRIQARLIGAYRAAFLIALPLGLILLVARVVRSVLKRRRRITVDALYMTAATVSCSIYLVLLSVIDALSFRLFSGTYMGTIQAVMIVACAVIIMTEATRVWRFGRRARQPR